MLESEAYTTMSGIYKSAEQTLSLKEASQHQPRIPSLEVSFLVQVKIKIPKPWEELIASRPVQYTMLNCLPWREVKGCREYYTVQRNETSKSNEGRHTIQ